MSNAWVTHPPDGDSLQKCRVIPGKVRGIGGRGGKELRLRRGNGPRPISWLAGKRPTKAMTGTRPQRADGHIGTEIRPRLLREAAAKNIPQWGEP